MGPGNDPSAGKRRSGRTRTGSTWPRATLTAAALGATRKKDTSLAARHQRPRGRRGHSEALTAVGHSIPTAARHLLGTGETHRETGADSYTRQNPDRASRTLIRELEALGHQVTIQPLEAAA